MAPKTERERENIGQVTKVKLICWFYKNEPAWCTVVHGIAKSRTRLSDQSELRIKEDPKLCSLDNEVRGNITFKSGSSNSISQSESFSLLSTGTVPNFSLQFTKLSYSQQIILPPTLLRNHCTLASLFLKLSSLFTLVSKEIFLSFPIFTVCHPEMFPQSYQASNSSFLLLWDVELLKRISYFQAHFFPTISSSPRPHCGLQSGFRPLYWHTSVTCALVSKSKISLTHPLWLLSSL